jgi:hypothetical protein
MRKSSGSALEASKKFMKHLKDSKNSKDKSGAKEKMHRQINE